MLIFPRFAEKMPKALDKKSAGGYNTKSNLGVAQMVARYLGVVEAVGSNPATQTKISDTPFGVPDIFITDGGI